VSEILRSDPAKEDVSFLQTCKHLPAAWCLLLSIFHHFLPILLHLITALYLIYQKIIVAHMNFKVIAAQDKYI